jgi:hypothetical protein
VLAAHELAEWYVESNCERRHDAFVDGFAGLQALNCAGEDVDGTQIVTATESHRYKFKAVEKGRRAARRPFFRHFKRKAI